MKQAPTNNEGQFGNKLAFITFKNRVNTKYIYQNDEAMAETTNKPPLYADIKPHEIVEVLTAIRENYTQLTLTHPEPGVITNGQLADHRADLGLLIKHFAAKIQESE